MKSRRGLGHYITIAEVKAHVKTGTAYKTYSVRYGNTVDVGSLCVYGNPIFPNIHLLSFFWRRRVKVIFSIPRTVFRMFINSVMVVLQKPTSTNCFCACNHENFQEVCVPFTETFKSFSKVQRGKWEIKCYIQSLGN